jgi:flavin-dependent dehydrogenase
MSAQSTGDGTQTPDAYDVAILGGGLAGLTLALQLKRARPETTIFVAEKRKGPAPEAAFKVGESTLEIGAHYMARVAGLQDHIDQDELPKMGVRFFFPAGDNADITQRAEYGPPFRPPLPTYQLDRGRFENELAVRNQAAGVDLVDDSRVEEVELDAEGGHRVTISRGGETRTVTARWVVDAAGRAAFLKRKLGLLQETPHPINSAWFRLGERLDLEQWSDDPEWLGRMTEPGLRWLSTNHLMDRGYWVWLIPLASGNTSIGIVADPRIHPLESYGTLETALDWLREHEPQLAGVLESKLDLVADFLKVSHYSHSTERSFSPDRWCLTGDAGVFIDPLFSPGSDFIGICNSLITDLVVADLGGEDISERAEFSNRFFLRYFESWLSQYLDLYALFDDVMMTVIKFSWYRAFYFPIPVRLFYEGKLGDADFLRQIEPELDRLFRLIPRVERMIRDWHALEQRRWDRAMLVKPPEFAAMRDVVGDLRASHENGPGSVDDETLKAKVRQMVELLEAAAVVTFHHAAKSLRDAELDPEARVDPHAISLQPERWEADGLFADGGLTLAEASEIAAGLDEELEHLRSIGAPVA